MNEFETKRVFLLRKGDKFRHMMVDYVVTHIKGGRIYYRNISMGRQTGIFESFGMANQMKVEIIKEHCVVGSNSI